MDDPQANTNYDDVRMRGFAARTTVENACAWIDSVLAAGDALPQEKVPLHEAAGRVLAQEVMSSVNVPSFDRSMMDGFALRGEDTYGANSYNPMRLRIIGTCLPGSPYGGTVAAGEAVRIMTGAPMPEGADAVLQVENTEVEGGSLSPVLLALGQVSPGKHIGQVGEDIRAGEIVAQAGRLLRPQDIGVLASIGCSVVKVVRRPRVRIVITGNELLPAGSMPRACQIADANGPMLASLVIRDGGRPLGSDIIPDTPDAILSALQDDAEITIVSGGSSVGQEDYVPKLLAQHGELAIHGIAMRPSSPTGMGRIGERLVFLLPGNPVSCLCAYDFFAGRAIRLLGGLEKAWPYRNVRLKLNRKLVSTVGRVDYARVQIVNGRAEPLAVSGASILSSTTKAAGFVVIPADSEGYPPGADVDVYLY